MLSFRFIEKPGAWLPVFACFVLAAGAGAQEKAVIVNHAPNVNGGGLIEGSIQQLAGESAALNGQATISGDWFVPGLPKVKINGNVSFGGVSPGTGSASPANYQITLNGGARLRRLVTRTDSVALPIVAAPPNPTGSRSVTINQPGQSVGDPSSLLHLTLNANAGDVFVPPGSYGRFMAGSGSGLVLGNPGIRSSYSLQELTLNSQSKLQLRGPVVLTISGNLNINAHSILGQADHPGWLTICMPGQVSVNLNSHSLLHGMLIAPKANVIVNAHSKLRGMLYCDRLTVNGQGVIQKAIAENQAPVVNAGDDQSMRLPATAALTGTATDDGLPAGAPLSYRWSKVSGPGGIAFSGENAAATMASFTEAGTYVLRLIVSDTDLSGADEVTVTVLAANQPPIVNAGENKLIHGAGEVPLAGSAADDGVPGPTLSYAWSKASGAGNVSFADAAAAQTAAVFAETGTYVLRLTVSDGELSASDEMQVVVNALPTVAIRAPEEGSVFVEGTQVMFAAEAADADDSVEKVEFYLGKVGEERVKVGEATTAPYSIAWTAAATGHWQIEARVIDSRGGSAASELQNILVKPANEPPAAKDQTITVDEDGSAAFTLDASDPNGDGLLYEIVTAPAHGTLDGTAPALVYAPQPNSSKADSFVYRATDAGGLSDTATVNITVRPINDAPVAAGQSVSTNEDTALAIVLAGTDVEGDALSFRITREPGHGVLSGTPPNLSYLPAADYHGDDIFEFVANDGTVDSAPAVVAITVVAVNDAPVAQSQEAKGVEDQPLDIFLSGTDVEESTLTYAIATQPAHGTLSGSGANLRYTPEANYYGDDSFSFRVNDGMVDSAPATVSIHLASVNDAPAIAWQSPAHETLVDAGANVTLSAAAEDADGSISRVVFYAGESEIGQSETGSLSWQPAAGTHSIKAVAVDNEGASAGTNAITLYANAAPVVEAGETQLVQEGGTVALNGAASDDGLPQGVSLAYAWSGVSGPGTVSFAEPGAATTTATFSALGAYVLRLTVSDSRLSGADEITIHVNGAPRLGNNNFSVDEDTVLNLTLDVTDPENEALTFQILAQPQHGALTGTGPGLVYAPAANYHGADAFTFRVTDPHGSSVEGTAAITVVSVNDPPAVALETPADHVLVDAGETVPFTVAVVDRDGTIASVRYISGETVLAEVTGEPWSAAWQAAAGVHNIRAVAVDNEGAATESAPHVLRVNNGPTVNAGADQTLASISVAATLQGTSSDDGLPSAEAHSTEWSKASGPGSVTFGNASELQTTATFDTPGVYVLRLAATDTRLSGSDEVVIHVNSPPAVGANLFDTNEETALEAALEASDPDGDTLIFELLSQPEHAQVTLTGQNFRFTPESNFVGMASFDFAVEDPSGLRVAGTARVDVKPLNDPPVAYPISFTTPEDTPIEVAFSGSDPDQDTLQYAIVTQPQHGSVSGTPLKYTPELNYNGPDTFTYKAGDGTAFSAVVSAAVTVAPVNDAPAARPASLITDQGVPLPITVGGSDVEGSPLQYQIEMAPEHGAISGQLPNIVYTPAAEYYGTDSFNYRVFDGELWSIPRAVTILINRKNHAPVAAGQSLTLAEDSQVEIVLAATDADQDPLSFAISTPPSHGTISGTLPNIVYRPNSNFHGADTFRFTATDTHAVSVPVEVTLTVTPVNDPPVTQSSAITVKVDTATNITLAAFDADNDSLQYTIIENVAHGTLSGSGAAGRYTPGPGYIGSDRLRFKVNDGTGDSNISEVLITVVANNDPPVANAQTVSCDEDTALPLVLTGSDPEGAPLMFSLIGGPARGTVSGTAPNLTYHPAQDFNGSDRFTFRVSDGVFNATASVEITVRPVNDAPVAAPAELRVVEGGEVNWVPGGTDIDSTNLSYVITQAPDRGQLLGESPNFIYRAPDAFAGNVVLSYLAKDPEGAESAPAEVTIRVVSKVRSRTFTTTSDFLEGALSKLTTEVPDQLSVTSDVSGSDFVWIPVHSKGSVVCIESDTGLIVGEYWTVPETVGIPYSSRTSIDSKGNVWIANERDNSLVKIANPAGNDWVDRNHNGVCDTSVGQNHILPWPGNSAFTAADERILLYVKTTGTTVRHVSVDGSDNVWSGGTVIKNFDLFDGKTGELLRTEPSIGRGGNGGLVDFNGVLWSTGTFLRWNTQMPLSSVPPSHWQLPPNRWGVAKDSSGNVWVTQDPSTEIAKYNTNGNLVGNYKHGASWSQGVAVDFNDHVWVAHSHCGDTVGHLLNNGTWLGNIPVTRHGPTGVAVDRKGRIWVSGTAGVVQRINPLGGPIGSDGNTPVGEVDYTSPYLGGTLWTYSLFAGSGQGVSTNIGRWTVVYDGEIEGTQWGPVVWNGELANDANFKVYVALSDDGGTYSEPQELTRENRTPIGTGRYISVRVDFDSGETGASPILHDLTVGTAGYDLPQEPIGWRISAGSDINGYWPDPILLRGLLYRTTASPPIADAPVLWSKESGSGEAALDNNGILQPTARFSVTGDYVMRVAATYLGETRSDDVRIHLVPYNKSPWTNAGPLLVLRSTSDIGQLRGEVRDDGLPEGAPLTSTWSLLNGAGAALFGDPNAAQTSVRFDHVGLYTLQLAATDTQYSHSSNVEARVGVTCEIEAAEGIVSWWQANYDGADHITGNQAFLEGASYGAGKVGAAWWFDGANDVVRTLSSETLDVAKAGSFTIEGWINIRYDYYAPFNQPIICWNNEGIEGVAITAVRRHGTISVRIPGIGGGTVAINEVPVGVDAWKHLAVTYDASLGIAAVYVDGSWVRAEIAQDLRPNTTGDLLFGNGAGRPFFGGGLDEMAIYSRALSAGEIADIVSAGATGRCPYGVNARPLVNAGPDRGVLAAPGQTKLLGTVTDDGFPVGIALKSKWTVLSGPGTVTFDDDSMPEATAQFSAPGVYVLQLHADDGYGAAKDTVQVRVDSPCSILAPAGLTAWLPLNGDLSEVAGSSKVVSGGGQFGQGRVSLAQKFDGNTDHLRLPACPALNIGEGEGFTIEFWINPAYDYYNINSTLLEWSDFATTGMRVGFSHRDTSMSVDLRDSSGAPHTLPPVVLGAWAWHHVSISYDKASGWATIFVDGTLKVKSQIGSFVPDTRNDLYIGYGRGRQYYNGLLDEISLYKRALAASELYAIYAAGPDGKCPNLGNERPVANAGPDLAVAAAGEAAPLAGTMSDDGLPDGTLQAFWEKVDGPGTVSFGDANTANTFATFSLPGIYILRLTADDGLAEGADEIEVRVGSPCIMQADQRLIGWWPFNANESDTVGSNDAGRNGGEYEPGKVSQALRFDGIDDYVRIAADEALDVGTGDGFSVEFWIKADYEYYHTNTTLLEWSDFGVSGMRVGFNHRHGNLSVDLKDTAGLSHVLPTVSIGTGSWRHVAITYDKSTGMAKVFVDGRLRLSDQLEVGPVIVDTRKDLYIGYSAGREYFVGALDELSVYREALEEGEIYAIVASGATGKCPYEGNQKPVANAGPDRNVQQAGAPVEISGSAADDGLPLNALSASWSKVDGPGAVQFSPGNSFVTSATFGADGVYLLRLTVSDGLAQSFDDVEVRVNTLCSVTVPAGVAAWWPMNGHERDVVGSNDFRRNGGSYETAKVSQGLRFDGTADYLRALASPSLDIGRSEDGFTVEFWLQPFYEYYHTDTTVVEWSSMTTGGARISLDQRHGNLSVNLKDTNGVSHPLPVVSIGTGAWRHVAVSYDRGTGRAKVYVDGVLRISNQAVLGQINVDTTRDLYVGYMAGRQYYYGLLDELTLYTRALDPLEIGAIYAAAATGKCPNRENRSPLVNAGQDKSIPQLGAEVALDGVVDDDGLPNGSLTVRWVKTSGPGEVEFDDETAIDTTATFTATGIYILQLSASDGAALSSDEMEVRVGVECSAQASDRLAAWWPFNGNVFDVASGNDARRNGGAFDLGRVSLGVRLDGIDDYMQVYASETLDIGRGAAGFAIEFWIHPQYEYYHTDTTLLEWHDLSTGGARVSFDNRNGNLGVNLKDAAGGSHSLTPLAVGTGAWHHIAISYDRASGFATVFVDGALRANNQIGSVTIGTDKDLYIGHSLGRNFFYGVLDELSLYSSPLSPAEIGAIYQAGPVGKCPIPRNEPPVVRAGQDQIITLPQTATVTGTAIDDGLPQGSTLNFEWSQVSGPGAAIFAEGSSLNTTVSFSSGGVYTLRLTAGDGALFNSDETVVKVAGAANQAPVVNAGPDQNVTLGLNATLSAQISDDGLPFDSALAVQWSKVSGPAPVVFASSSSANTTASFTTKGVYVLRATASDSQLTGQDTLQVTVGSPGNEPPSLDLGPDRELSLSNWFISTDIADNATDDGNTNEYLQLSWSQVSGPSAVQLVQSEIGMLASFDRMGDYVLRCVAFDGEFTVVDEIKVTVKADTQYPIVTLDLPVAGAELPRRLPATLTASATDPDGNITLVEFYANGEWIGQDASAPYSFQWMPQTAGAATLYARAIDNLGAATSSAETTVTVAIPPPSISITNPVAGRVYLPGQTIEVNASAYSDNGVSKVEFYGDGVRIGEDATAPFGASWTGAMLGQHTLTATLIDSGGAALAAAPVTIEVKEDPGVPVVEILSPKSGTTVTHPASVTGTATSQLLKDWKLQYRLVAQKCNEWITFATGAVPVEEDVLGTFDPTLVPYNGIAEVRVVATDHAGRATTSESVYYSLEGDMKIGAFTTKVTDVAIPMAGLSIEVGRVYNSHDNCSGDFGRGWNLDVSLVQLQKNFKIGEKWQHTIYPDPPPWDVIPVYGMEDWGPHIIAIVFPNGETLRFIPRIHYIDPNTGELKDPYRLAVPWRFFNAFRITFEPIPGTYGTLEAEMPDKLYPMDDQLGETVWMEDDLLNDPWAPVFEDPSSWTLTMRDGRKVKFDENGRFVSMMDRNGNSITQTETGIYHSNGKAITWTRDTQGRITKVTDPAGESLKYSYDAFGNLAKVESRTGEATTMTYNSAQDLASIFDPRGVPITRNEYDVEGRVIRVLDAQGRPTQFIHDIPGNKETIIDSLGNSMAIEYGASGRVLRKVDGRGRSTSYSYAANGMPERITDAEGNAILLAYDPASGWLTRLTDQTGRSMEMAYNAEGRPEAMVDGEGNRFEISYDAAGRPAQVRTVDGSHWDNVYDPMGRLSSQTNSIGATTQYGYHPDGWLNRIVDSLGGATQIEYDANGNEKSITLENVTPVTAGLARFPKFAMAGSLGLLFQAGGIGGDNLQYQYEYNADGDITKATDPYGNETRFEYQGRFLTAEIDANGRRTSYSYDPDGNMREIVHPDGVSEKMHYDSEGNLLSHTDRAGRTTSYDYDFANNFYRIAQYLPKYQFHYQVIKVTHHDGLTEQFGRNKLGHLISYTNRRGKTTTYENDKSGRPIRVTDAHGNSAEITYNGNGLVKTAKDQLGHVRSYLYSLTNRVGRVSYPNGSSQTYRVDKEDRLLGRIDQSGNEHVYSYDSENRLTGVSDPEGGVTKLEWDNAGRLLSVTDAKNRKTEYEHGANASRATHASGETESWTMDNVGNILTYTNPSGKTTSYEYNSMDQLVRKVPPAESGQGAITYTYTASGMRKTMADATGTTTYEYDAMDRLKKKSSPFGTIEYEWDANGNLTRMKTGTVGGTDITYQYDDLDRLTSMVTGFGTTQYSYDAVGNLTKCIYPNGVVHTFAYDNLNRLTSILAVNAAGTEIGRYEYTLGESGQRLQMVENGSRTVAYGYDKLYRLKSEAITGDPHGVNGIASYSYDPVGNRLSRSSTIPGLLSRSDEVDELSDRLSANQWDANGNTTGSEQGTDSYDFEDRLTKRVSANGHQVEILYDGDGNKVQETIDGMTIRYLVDEMNPTGYSQILEEFVNGELVRVYTHGHDLVSQELRPLGQSEFVPSYYGYDGSMSVRYLTDEDGVVTDRYTFDAFGNLLHATGSTDNRYRFSGEEWSEALQLVYLRARYLNPQTGRFWNADTYRGTVMDPRSLHRYVYANNNAANCVDPSGNIPTLAGLMCEIALTFSASAFEEAAVAAKRGEKLTPGQFLDRVILSSIMQMASPLIQFNDFFDTLGSGDEAAAYGQLIDSFTGMGLGRRMAEFQAEGMMEERAMREELRDAIIMQTMIGGIDDWAGAACFVAGTEVWTPGGRKRIETIQPGDQVWSADIQTGERRLRKVTEVFSRHSEGLVALKTSGKEILTTVEHPFRVKRGQDLASRSVPDDGESREQVDSKQSAGERGPPQEGAWVAAGDLRPGDVFECTDGEVVLQTAELVAGLFTVHNIEVEEDHNYFVGSEGVLVHNYGLYVLRDKVTNEIKYVGIGDVNKRLARHAKHPVKGLLKQEVVFRTGTLTKAQARGLEQKLIGRFGGAISTRPGTGLLNRINSFRKTNPNAALYRNSGRGVFKRALSILGR